VNNTKNNHSGAKYLLRRLEALFEIGVFCVVYFYIWKFFYREQGFYPYYGNGKFILAGVYAMLMLTVMYNCEGFKFGYLKFTDTMTAQWISIVLVNFITYFQLCLMANHMLNIFPMIIFTLTGFAMSALFVYIYTAVYHSMYVPKNMVMISGKPDESVLAGKMKTRSDKYNISQIISANNGLDEILRQIEGFDAVVLDDVPAELRNDVLKHCYGNCIRTYAVPKISDIINRGAEEIALFDTPLLLIKGYGPTAIELFIKRFFDVFLGVLALILFSPLMMIIAIAIKLEDKGPVFYKQERVTLNHRNFYIIKFRSMIINAEKAGEVIPAENDDPRITRVGKVIRPTRLDELPQILNIIKGDMSIVGPRPERVEHYGIYEKEIPEWAFRTKVKGGLTGYAQVYGKYNTSAYDKLRMDLMYIENYSFMLDIKIIFMTFQVLFKKEKTEGFDSKRN
jgi:exopolysaccharide biosynthesis polyprenyl glycosylphosphotransferase